MKAYRIAAAGSAASRPANPADTIPATRLSWRSSSMVSSSEAAANGIVKLQTDESLKGGRVLCEAIAPATTNPTRIRAASTKIAEPTRAKARAGDTSRSTLDARYLTKRQTR